MMALSSVQTTSLPVSDSDSYSSLLLPVVLGIVGLAVDTRIPLQILMHFGPQAPLRLNSLTRKLALT